MDSGIKLLTASTAVRWFGWGLGETFIPVFLLLFSGTSFFVTGLLASVYYVVFFLFIPFAGTFADNYKAKYLILFGLFIFVFIGLGYFFAGVSQMIIFLIIARGLTGIADSLDQTGREAYFIRHSSKKKESEVFGYLDKIAIFWWVIAVLIGLFLINYVEIHWLLLAIVPTSLISFFMMLGLKEKAIKKKKMGNPYSKMFREIRGFNKNLRKLSVMVFFFGGMSATIYYFVPAVTYSRGGSLVGSAVLILVFFIPSLFGEAIGKFADKLRYKGYYICLCSLVLVLLILAFSSNYYFLLFSMFFVGITYELSKLTNVGFMARNSDFKEIGEIDSALNGVKAMGSIFGPILFGLLLSLYTPMSSYLIVIVIVLFMFVFVYRNRK
jgi:MFS family permease